MTFLLQHPGGIAVRSVELSRPLNDIADVTDYSGVRVYAIWNDRPAGYADIANQYQPIDAAWLRDALASALAPEHLRAAGESQPPLAPEIPVSIVVATYDRPADLDNCLRLLHEQKTPRRVEIVVVDNHPPSGLTPPVVAAYPGVVLVREPRQGLAYARNAGFVACTGAIAVCTDDDVTPPPDWLEKLLAPFVRPDIMAVTGNVLPLELETAAQRLFEVYGGLGRGFARREVGPTWFRSQRIAVPTWELGATANAAFRTAIFAHPQIGLMDEALGPGMPSGVGEDTYLFYKILKAGYTIVYEPGAYVWHRHRRTLAALRRQLYCYGKGHIAYLLTTLLRDDDQRALVRLLFEMPKGYLWYLKQFVRGRGEYPLALAALEIISALAGPWALWQSHRRVHREGRSGPYAPPQQRAFLLQLQELHNRL
jgi:GT2 family glycosyltransferase